MIIKKQYIIYITALVIKFRFEELKLWILYYINYKIVYDSIVDKSIKTSIICYKD